MSDGNIGIIRSPSLEERKEYVEVGTETPVKKFLTELAKVEQVFVKKHMPFDGQCAKLDFADELESVEKESMRMYGFVRQEDVRKMKFDGLEKYGDVGRMEMVDETDVFEQMNINGIKSSVKTGVMRKFVCKRGHGISVFVPNVMEAKVK